MKIVVTNTLLKKTFGKTKIVSIKKPIYYGWMIPSLNKSIDLCKVGYDHESALYKLGISSYDAVFRRGWIRKAGCLDYNCFLSKKRLSIIEDDIIRFIRCDNRRECVYYDFDEYSGFFELEDFIENGLSLRNTIDMKRYN